jgi:hypothetical protein
VSTQIQTIYNPQDVGNRRIVRNNPNFNQPGGGPTYGEPGWTCQDWNTGKLYSYYGYNGEKGWADPSPRMLLLGAEEPSGVLTVSPGSIINRLADDPLSSVSFQGANDGFFSMVAAGSWAIVAPGDPRLIGFYFQCADSFAFSDYSDPGTPYQFTSLEEIQITAGADVQLFARARELPKLASVIIEAGDFPSADNIFISVERASLRNNGYLQLTGPKTVTSASAAARASLIARGWTLWF